MNLHQQRMELYAVFIVSSWNRKEEDMVELYQNLYQRALKALLDQAGLNERRDQD